MKKILIILWLLIPVISFAQNTDSGVSTIEKELAPLLGKEWQYDLKTVNILSKKSYNLILKRVSKKDAKKIKKHSSEFMEEIKKDVYLARLIVDATAFKYTYAGEIIDSKWQYDVASKLITLKGDEKNDEKKHELIALDETEFRYRFGAGIEYRMIPVPKKIEDSQFELIKDLAEFHGNVNSDIVVINTQGGPETTFFTDEVKNIARITDTENYLYVNVHQVQTKTPDLFTNTDITFKQAKAYDNKSVADLHKVVSYFKNQLHKKVYVLGISFGAFMTQDLIATYGVDCADGFVIMVGRLDIDEVFWTAFSKGKIGMFKYSSKGKLKIKTKKQKDTKDKNMSKLAAGLGHKRYTQELNKYTDLSKVTYIYGDRDEQVGGLKEDEITFLKNKKANVILVEKGTHDSTIDKGIIVLKEILNKNR